MNTMTRTIGKKKSRPKPIEHGKNERRQSEKYTRNLILDPIFESICSSLTCKRGGWLLQATQPGLDLFMKVNNNLGVDFAVWRELEKKKVCAEKDDDVAKKQKKRKTSD